MMHRSKRHGIELTLGTVIQGKWHGKKYHVKSRLGSGTVGTVYLCESNGKLVALKMSHQDASITTEVNVLKALQQVQGKSLGPYLIDVDDWVINQQVTYSFYVMEYLRGENVVSFVERNGQEWAGVFIMQLLSDLSRLHEAGWIFGDLKVDNLLVLSTPTRVRLLDVGGTTQVGRSIKEYTDFFDRGYWGLGTRKAEPSYDLFALVMVCLAIFYPKHFPRTKNSADVLLKRIDAVIALKPFKESLKKAVLGRYTSSMEMQRDLMTGLNQRSRTDQRDSRSSHVVEVGGVFLLSAIYFGSSLWFP